jgi:hypothetical protein
MVPLPKSERHTSTTFLMLEEQCLVFDGSPHDLVASEN